MNHIDREIEVIQNIIRVLKRCLRIHLKEKDIKGTVRTLHDIRIVKREMKKIIEAQTGQEPPHNEPNRSGKMFHRGS